jgi:UDP-N-acetylglucosamine:LPS N-acetylglucosamine transferase
VAKFKIALCFSDTGGGHRSAVDAVHAAILDVALSESRGHEFEIVLENIIEKSHPINRRFVDLYNYFLRHNQNAMKYYYWLIHMLKPNESDLSYKYSGPYVERFLIEHEPDVVVSVHPMCNQYLARAMKQTGFDRTAKLITIVTDPNGEFWKGWACLDADLTIVPNDLGRTQLIAWGVPSNKIRALGMPVNPDFVKPPSTGKEEFRHHLGLYRDRLTVCINSGWAGGGNMMDIYEQMSAVKRPVQAIFLCGHNRALYEKARRASRKSSIPTAVLPFHDKMSDLMSAVDLMVTKAGGLTSFEAIARRLPLALDMITPPMPQEMGTVELLVENGLAKRVRTPQDVISIIEELQVVEDRSQIKLPEAHCLDRAGAIFDIARAVLGYCDPMYQPNPDHRPAENIS